MLISNINRGISYKFVMAQNVSSSSVVALVIEERMFVRSGDIFWTVLFNKAYADTADNLCPASVLPHMTYNTKAELKQSTVNLQKIFKTLTILGPKVRYICLISLFSLFSAKYKTFFCSQHSLPSYKRLPLKMLPSLTESHRPIENAIVLLFEVLFNIIIMTNYHLLAMV